MDYIHEIIDFGSHIPIKFFIHSIGEVKRHWHQSVELLFVLSGQVQIFVRDQTYLLQESDIVIINSYDIHSLQSKDAVLAAFQIKLSMFDLNIEDFSQYSFNCNSAVDDDSGRYLKLKKLLAQMIRDNASPKPHQEVCNKSMAYAVLFELLTVYGQKNPDSTMQKNASDMMERMGRILNYMNHHYQDKISLKSCAQHFFISEAYLSRLFKKYIGVNFYEYLTNTRLNHARELLLSEQMPIDQIAECSGFLNSRAFVTAFKKEYQMLPSQYRKGQLPVPETNKTVNSAMDNYFEFELSHQLDKLAKYLDEPTEAVKNTQKSLSASTVLCQVTHKQAALRHTWRRLVCVGRAKLLLFDEIRDSLRHLQRNIGYQYIKFHGIFDDDMMVCSENASGEIILSFTYIDKIMDFLISINLRPLLQLSFMPICLAKPSGHMIFEDASCIAAPKDIRQWDYLVKEFFLHLINRYGLEEVKHWPVCFWNEPDTSVKMFGFNTKEEYRQLYVHTYKTVKGICSDFKFGSSSHIYDTLLDLEWNKEYIEFIESSQCVPDFINFHFYPMVSSSTMDNITAHRQLKYHSSPDFLSQVLDSLKKMPLHDYFEIPIYCMTEWNASVSHRDWLGDTAYKGAYVAKNILENYDGVESFGYWSCSDLIEESPIPNILFHGGMDMLTYNNIPKPACYAFEMMAGLGDTLLCRGDGYFITQKGNEYVGVLYNYRHFSGLYAQGELFNMTSTNRYAAFPDESSISMTLNFTELPDQDYVLTETYINKEHGSCFDQWQKMGGLPMSDDEYTRLRALSAPALQKKQVQAELGNYHYHVVLKPHEVRKIRLTPVYH